MPDSDKSYLSVSESEGFSKEQCHLAINELYARHGRKFKDNALQEYFISKSCHEGTVNPDDFQKSWLNDYEVSNRNLIIEFEKNQGY